MPTDIGAGIVIPVFLAAAIAAISATFASTAAKSALQLGVALRGTICTAG